MAPARILLCGDVKGKLRQLIKRVSYVNKTNGPFDALLCVGQFFPDNVADGDEFMEFVDGKQEVPLPTYFIGDYGDGAVKILSYLKSKVGNTGFGIGAVGISNNLYWLKGSGIFDIAGLRVAYISGRYVPSAYQERGGATGAYHEDDVDTLRAFADEPKIVDLFLSNEWPEGILNGVSDPPDLNSSELCTAIVAELVAELKPRYHIAGSQEYFFARDPFLNENSKHVTRFVGLAAVGNEKKQKFLHALSLMPASSMKPEELFQRPPNTTISPFLATANTQRNPKSLQHESEGQYWRYAAPQSKKQKTDSQTNDKICFEFAFKGTCTRGDSCNFKHDSGSEKPLPKGSCFDFITKGKCERGPECKFRHSLDEEPKSRRSQPSAPCWFCLSSPDVDVHLVVTVGEHCYCAMAKGGLVDGHVLIIPVDHSPSIASLSDNALAEVSKYKETLRRLYKSQQKTMVVFERYLKLKAGTHAHLQIIPIPLLKASQLRGGFVSAAKQIGFTFDVVCPDNGLSAEKTMKENLQDGRNYFFVELPEGTLLYHALEPGESIPMQFGREVCAKILGVPDRTDWRVCKLSKDEEEAATMKFREELKSVE